MNGRIWFTFVLLALRVTGVATAQTTTGTISGHVVDTQGLAAPGVRATVRSPNLQGTRSAVTSPNGDYLFPLLPPGAYTITFELAGFAILTETREVAATQSVTVDATMTVAGVREIVDVTAHANVFIGTVQSATNIKATTLSTLPTDRTIIAAVDLSTGVHATGPLSTPTMSGGMSFENAFMLNGVQITDNIFGSPLPLYIEDAVQEVTTGTSGVSAEFGRFTGGTVNAVTKSGGNVFAGSFRTTLADDAWRSASPFGEPKTANVVPTFEFVGGGPIVTDRTWFFTAGRLFDNAVTRTLSVTAVPYETRDHENRFEGKLTQSLGLGQNLTVGYTKIHRKTENTATFSVAALMDLRSLTDQNQSQDLLLVRYTGAVRSALSLEAQVSTRHSTLNQGGTSTDRIQGTQLIDRQRGRFYWAPFGCALCPNDQRNGIQVLAKANYFVSTARGAHNIAFGYDTFNNNSRFDNHQSASDYVVSGKTSIIRDGVVYPVFNSGDGTTFIQYRPILVHSLGWNFRTHALFVNDTLRYNERFSFNLGLRWDGNHGADTSGVLVARGSAVSPRLGVVWDVVGDGRWAVTASFSKYVAPIAGTVGNAGSPAGRPATFSWNYGGPSVNTGPDAPLISSDQALQILFGWFDSVGSTDLRPYRETPNIPGLTTRVRDSLDSPNVIESAGGVSHQFGLRGAVRADLTYRDYRDLYAIATNASTGSVTGCGGQMLDLSLIENTNAVKRRYASLTIQGNYRPIDRLDIGGNYVLSRLWGTFEGDGATGIGLADVLRFPEYFDLRWHNPEGDLLADQRHRFRLWSTYRVPVPNKMGTFTLAAIERVESGTPYGALGLIDSRPFATNPGYLNPPPTVSYYFTARDGFRAKTQVRTDLAFNYGHKVGSTSRHELFAQVQVLNAFNQFQIINVQDGHIGLSVLTGATTPERYQAFNPFTTVPVQGVNWDYGPSFGRALGAGAYTLPRTFLMSFGIRY